MWDKLSNAIIAKLIGWVVVFPLVVIWGWWMWGAEVKARAWTAPVENAEAIRVLTEGLEDTQTQYEEVRKDLAYLKMLWGVALVTGTGGDEVYALVNTRSPAVRFRPGQEIWITNNSEDAEVRIKCKIKEGGFRDDREVLIRLSKKAGEELEAIGEEISVGIEIVQPDK
jgi:hypothetical protein